MGKSKTEKPKIYIWDEWHSDIGYHYHVKGDMPKRKLFKILLNALDKIREKYNLGYRKREENKVELEADGMYFDMWMSKGFHFPFELRIHIRVWDRAREIFKEWLSLVGDYELEETVGKGE
jgi:hypothetical protein